MEKVIFFGNGPLAEGALEVLKKHFEIIFHAKTKEDLEKVKELKTEFPEAHGILASFGVMIREDILGLFEPEGILNIHPSLLPKYRGASPIETAILEGESDFSVSIMKLVKKMDAGPVYYRETLKGLPLNKAGIYRTLAETGAKWLVSNLAEPREQEGEPTFTQKFEKNMGILNPEQGTAEEIFRKIVAFQGFPKPKYTFYGQNCIILEAHIEESGRDTALMLKCRDGRFVVVDKIQPEGRKAMDTKSFLNGYRR